jgi:hypothetical protein
MFKDTCQKRPFRSLIEVVRLWLRRLERTGKVWIYVQPGYIHSFISAARSRRNENEEAQIARSARLRWAVYARLSKRARADGSAHRQSDPKTDASRV